MESRIKETMYRLQLVLVQIQDLEIEVRAKIMNALSRLTTLDSIWEPSLEQKLLKKHPHFKEDQMIRLGDMGLYCYISCLNMFVVFDDGLEIAGGITADSIIHQIDDFEPFIKKPTKKKRAKGEIHNEDIIYVHGMQLIMDEFDNPFERAIIVAICTLITEEDSNKALKQKKYLAEAIRGFETTPTYEINSEDGEVWRYLPYENIFQMKAEQNEDIA